MVFVLRVWVDFGAGRVGFCFVDVGIEREGRGVVVIEY